MSRDATSPAIPAAKPLHGQWRISDGNLPPLDGAARHDVGRWRLEAFPTTTIRPLIDGSGGRVGLLAGTVIDHAAPALLDGPVRLDLPADASGLDAAMERGLYRYGGSWLAIVTAGGKERVYLDADGTLSCVYNPVARTAASTAGLLLDDASYSARFDAALHASLDVAGEGWFPSGLTAHKGIQRLLCNHTLDLATFQPLRHWPVQGFTHRGALHESALEVADIVRRQAEALLAKGKVVVALTGGNETRFLLAAYRPILKELSFVTVSAPATQRDVVIAKALAERFGLRHLILPLVEASEAEQAAWAYAAGHCVTGPNMVSHPSIRPLQGRFDWFLGGLGGEIGRAFFWRPTDTPEMRLEVEDLVPRFGMPPADAVTEATAAWLEGVSGFDALTRLDLAYLELRMSAWSAAQTYAQSFVNHLHPLIHRDVYSLMLDLPPEAKRGNLLIKEAVAALWPELGEIPINRYGDYRDVLHVLKRSADHKRVLKKLRKLFG